MLIVVRVKERIYGIGTGSTRGCVAVEPHRKQIQNNIEYKVTEHLKKKRHTVVHYTVNSAFSNSLENFQNKQLSIGSPSRTEMTTRDFETTAGHLLVKSYPRGTQRALAGFVRTLNTLRMG